MKKNNIKKSLKNEARHSYSKCMQCESTPIYEVLWAEGMGHAWFCAKHLKGWVISGDGKGDIISVKEIKDGQASKKFNENKNPNIWEELKKEWNIREAAKPYYPEKVKDDQLVEDWRIFGAWHSTLKNDGKFKYTEDEILNDFVIPALKEIIKRGNQEFHPENWQNHSRELYLEAFKSLITTRLQVPSTIGEKIFKDECSTIVSSKKYIAGNFKILVSDNKAYGFIREMNPEQSNSNFLYGIRDFIPLLKIVEEVPPEGSQTHYGGKRLKKDFGELFTEKEIKELDFLSENEYIKKISERTGLSEIEVKENFLSGD